MILDKDKSKLISRDILLSTYKELLDNSGLKKKLARLEKLIKELVVELYRKYVFSDEFLQLFDKSKKIAKTIGTKVCFVDSYASPDRKGAIENQNKPSGNIY